MTLEEFVREAREKAPVIEGPALKWALNQPGLVQRTGTWCEFGVQAGSTLVKIFQQCGDAVCWGFDSFHGLPENWNSEHPKGSFKQTNLPVPPDGVNLMVGWYKNTLPAFLPPSPITFVHMDCDLYSSAREVMLQLLGRKLLASGAVMVWDDVFTEPYDKGIVRALYEAAEAGFRFEWLGSPRRSEVAVIRALDNPTT